MANEEIREFARERGVRLWQVAEALGINDGNLSRKLRHELPAAEQDAIRELISEIAGKED